MNTKLVTVLVCFGILMLAGTAHTVQAYKTGFLEVTLLNQDPDPAQPGDYVELRWKVQKLGNDMISDIKFYLEADYPFFFDAIDTPERDLGDWAGYATEDEFYTLFYKLRVDKDALKGSYPVKLRKTSSNSSIWEINEFDIRVAEKKAPEFIFGQMRTSPSKLKSGMDEAEINLEIANIGDEAAENVVVGVELPDGFTPSFSYSNRDAIGTLPAGASSLVHFYVDIAENVSGGAHKAKLKISYKEPNDDEVKMKSKIIPLEIPLKEKPAFTVTEVKTIPESVSPGTDAELRLKIQNTGGEDAKSVSVKLFKDATQPIDLVEKSDYIGLLKPGESGEAVLQISVDPKADAKKYQLDLEIRAIDGAEVIVEDKSISVEVNDAAASGGGTTGGFMIGASPMILGIGVLVLIIVAFIAYKAGKSSVKTIKVKKATKK